MLFNFRLWPSAAIAPWGGPGELKHSWYSLSFGWYWIDVGAAELFRYTPEIIAGWPPRTVPLAELACYDDYQVARLWLSLLELLPAALEPLPAALVQRLALLEHPGSLLSEVYRHYLARIPEDDDVTRDLFWETFSSDWLGARYLDSGYLRSKPAIVFWSVGEQLYVEWDTRGPREQQVPVWTAGRGRIGMKVADFLAEVRDFDARLLAAMGERVAEILQGGAPAGVAIDLAQLQQAQHDGLTWLGEALLAARGRRPTDWDAILAALDRLDARLDAIRSRLPEPGRDLH